MYSVMSGLVFISGERDVVLRDGLDDIVHHLWEGARNVWEACARVHMPAPAVAIRKACVLPFFPSVD